MLMPQLAWIVIREKVSGFYKNLVLKVVTCRTICIKSSASSIPFIDRHFLDQAFTMKLWEKMCGFIRLSILTFTIELLLLVKGWKHFIFALERKENNLFGVCISYTVRVSFNVTEIRSLFWEWLCNYRRGRYFRSLVAASDSHDYN